MNKKMIKIVLIAICVVVLSNGYSSDKKGSAIALAEPAPVATSALEVTGTTDQTRELYLVGNGKVGVFSPTLTVDDVKKIVVERYSGQCVETTELAGEGSKAQVINVFIPATTDKPSVKIILSDGGIYQILALSAEFKTAKGLHVGSTWAQIRQAYPNANLTFEGVVAFRTPDDRVTCEVETGASRSDVNWEKIRTGQESPPDDLKIVRLFTN